MKVKERERGEVPISAMIDVVFLLLVFFIVTSTEVTDEAFVQVNAPGQPEPPVEIEKNPTLEIFVLGEHYEMMGKRYSHADMDVYLGNISQIMQDPSVNIKVSKKAKHKKISKITGFTKQS